MLRRLIIAAAALCALGTAPAMAAGDAHHPEEHAFSFEGPFGTYDMGAVQRGFAVYKQVCSSCHSMSHLSYRHLGERGGPFAAYQVRNHETGELEVVLGMPAEAHGATFVDINDNPFVRAIADDVMIAEIDRSTGETVERAGRASDRFRSPFANEFAARASNGGAYPPDLSVINAARHGGAEYIRSLLMHYTGEEEGGKYVNHYFPGGLIGMAPPLSEGILDYEDGTPATVAQMSTDVATFLQWATDPHMEARKSLGFQVLAFLLILTVLLYIAYKQVWRGQKH